MNKNFGCFLAILALVWATSLRAQTVELGGINNDGGSFVNFGIADSSNNEKITMPLSLSAPVAISKVVIHLAKVGNPTDNAVIEVRQGSPDGAVLASGSIGGSSVGATGSRHELTVSSFVVPSGTIHVVYSRSGASDPRNFFKAIRGTSASAYGIVSSGGYMYLKTGYGWNGTDFANSPIVSLWGTLVSLGQVTLSPASLDFGNVNVGQTAQLTLRIKNTGTAALALNSAVSNNSTITFSPAIPPSANANAGDSTAVVVSFMPTAAGSISGNITITHNGVNSPTVVAVTGNGVASGGGGSSGSGGSIVTGPMTFSNTNPNIGAVNVGASASTIIYLRNPSSSVVAVGLAVPNSEFGVSPVSTSVPVNDSVAVTVSFIPSSGGTKTTTLVASYGSNNSASAVLTGTGVGSTSPIPVLTVSSTNVSVDSTIVNQTRGFTVSMQNTGASNLFITNMYIGGNNVSAFTLTSASAVTVGSGETYPVSILFGPRVAGLRTAVLNINHNGSGGSTQISLSGVGKESPPEAKPVINIKATSLSGMPPYSITFTNENTGGSVTRTEWQVIRLRDDALGIGIRSTAEVFPWYQESYTYNFTEVGRYVIELDLEGRGGGDHQPMRDTVWISIKDPKISVSQEVVALPAVELGKGSSTAKFSIANVGESGLNVIRFQMSGLDSTDFRVITLPDFSVSPNSTKDIEVEFRPIKTIGDKQTYLYIHFIGPDSPARVKLSSTATDPPYGPASIIDFTANKRQGIDSLAVQFSYRLEGVRYSSLMMYFGDGDSSSVFDPVHVYMTKGKFSPNLVVTLANGEKVTPKVKENYIEVITLPPSPDFNGSGGKIDFADFFMLAEQINKASHTVEEVKKYDLNVDGFINMDDFFAFNDVYGKEAPVVP
ncbi:MAG: choice-of-anchor D domain-containing protein [bacterium]|nr:choice-of-anchor D domain-containing protein [bacterium]